MSERWSDLWAMDPGFTMSDEAMGIGELKEGMRVRIPSGQILTVTTVSEPDSDGVVRATCSVEADDTREPRRGDIERGGASRPEKDDHE